MTAFVATLPVKRRTPGGQKSETLYGYGASAVEAYSDAFAHFAFANRGRDPKTPLLVRDGKIRIWRDK